RLLHAVARRPWKARGLVLTGPAPERGSETVPVPRTIGRIERRVQHMRRTIPVACLIVGLTMTIPAFGQVGKGLSGPHYNLNIIGVPHDKSAPMNNPDRHTIFVPLQSGDDVSRQVKIYYVPGDDFAVIDGNCTDDNQCTIMVPS